MIYPFLLLTDVGKFVVWASTANEALSLVQKEYEVDIKFYDTFHRDTIPEWVDFDCWIRMLTRFDRRKAIDLLWTVDSTLKDMV